MGTFSDKAAESAAYDDQIVLFDEFQYCQENIFHHKRWKDQLSISWFILTNKEGDPKVHLNGLTIFFARNIMTQKTHFDEFGSDDRERPRIRRWLPAIKNG